MLPLTFANDADYDKVQTGDNVSIRGLQSFAPGKPLELIVKKKDGKELPPITLKHQQEVICLQRDLKLVWIYIKVLWRLKVHIKRMWVQVQKDYYNYYMHLKDEMERILNMLQY